MEDLRSKLKRRLESKELSLRQAQELTGVSFSTLSRFLRGSEVTAYNMQRIESWLSGLPIPKAVQVQCKRVTVANKTFLITIELVKD